MQHKGSRRTYNGSSRTDGSGKSLPMDYLNF